MKAKHQADFERGLRALALVSECAKNAKTPADLATALAARVGNEFHSFDPLALFCGLTNALTGLIDSAEAAIDPEDDDGRR